MTLATDAAAAASVKTALPDLPSLLCLWLGGHLTMRIPTGPRLTTVGFDSSPRAIRHLRDRPINPMFRIMTSHASSATWYFSYFYRGFPPGAAVDGARV